MEWTPEQRRIIDYGKGDLLVSASAGSGKTTVMLGRVMRLIEEGVSLRNMLISTFTVSAADDMRGKLARKLREKIAELSALKGGEGDGAATEKRCRDALDYLPNADICTLHKYCQKLIRKYFYVTGDDPAFEIADEGECAIWRNEAVTQAMTEAAAGALPDYPAVLRLYMKRRSDARVREIVTEVMTFVDAQEDADAWLAHACDAYSDDGECRAYLSAVAAERYGAVMVRADELDMHAAAMDLLSKAKKYTDEVRARVNGADIAYSRAAGITPLVPELRALRKRADDYAAFLDAVANAHNEEAERSARVFVALAVRARELYARTKAERGKFDFTDLERKAKAILSSDEGDRVRDSLAYVFIDEYQDINPLQESIIALLGKDNLFFVGDIKQSIYAFRNCSPDAFSDKRAALGAEGVVELNRNYRSKAGILRFSNALFSRIMTEGFGSVDYAGSGMFAVDEPPSNDGSVEIVRTGKAERSGENVDFSEPYSVRDSATRERVPASETETDAVVRRIKELLAERVEATDDSGATRSVSRWTYDDIVVLVRTRSESAMRLARKLRGAGIPVSLSARLAPTEGRCNRLLISFLRLLDNFRDDVALTAVMRSVIGGFTDGELADCRAADAAAPFWMCVLKKAETDDKFRAFTEDIARYTELAGLLPLGELAGRITSEKKLFASALGEELGVARSDALGRLVEGMSAFGGTLPEYLEYVTGAGLRGADVPPQPGSVRIMTVHASKGLEFPVVLMCGLSGAFRTDSRSGELPDSDLGMCVESRVAETGETVPSLPLLAARERKRRSEAEEEMRVLYVALTRARDKMILFLPDGDSDAIPPEECKRFSDWLDPTARSFGQRTAEESERTEDVARQAERALDPAALEQLRRLTEPRPAARTGESKRSVTSLIAGEYSRLDDGMDDRPAPALTAPEYDRRDAMRRGTAFHAALEKTDFFALLADQLERLAATSPDFDLVERDLLESARRTLSEELKGAELYREQPFLFSSPAEVNGENDGMMLQGVIDLLAVRGGEAEIIDYKTGALTPERLAKYSRQLTIYAEAVRRVLGLNVTALKLYMIDERRMVDAGGALSAS